VLVGTACGGVTVERMKAEQVCKVEK